MLRFLTDEGIEHLREYLNIPSEVVPATLKKSTRPLERDTRWAFRTAPSVALAGHYLWHKGSSFGAWFSI